MKYQTFKVAAAQMDCVLGDTASNLKKMNSMCDEAARNGANIICFPELATTGYNPQMIGEKYYTISEKIPGPSTELLGRTARKNNQFIIIGISEQSSVPGVLYNSQICISPSGEIISLYRKIHVWGMEKMVWKESTSCEYGTFDLPWCKAGMMICYDTSFPETARVLRLLGAKVIFDSAAWRIQESDIWDLNTRTRALENHIFMICANRCGKEGDVVFNGQSRIIAPRGTLLATAGQEETIIYADIDLSAADHENELLNYLEDRRPEAYQFISVCRDI